MSTVQTCNKWLWRVGDQATVVFNVQPSLGLGVTKGKEYPATVTNCTGWSADLRFIDDNGNEKTKTADRNTDRDGYESFIVTIPIEDYIDRSNSYHAVRVKQLTDQYHHDLETLLEQSRERLKLVGY